MLVWATIGLVGMLAGFISVAVARRRSRNVTKADQTNETQAAAPEAAQAAAARERQCPPIEAEHSTKSGVRAHV